MKVLIAAGGTGGHIYPGIAVAKEIMRRDPESEVLFVGTARGLEIRIVPENGFQLALINSTGLKNVGIVGKIKGAFRSAEELSSRLARSSANSGRTWSLERVVMFRGPFF
ncbi:MAG: glycosyltransferase [Acidobacteria bacterium]|nr:glycosyltransferase [Acidobacteriota bacterium]